MTDFHTGLRVGNVTLSPYRAVEHLLDEMKSCVAAGYRGKFDRLSDELAVLTKAYILPEIPGGRERWIKYGLTGARMLVSELLYSRMGRIVSKGDILNALYFRKPEKEPHEKIVDVHICHIRRNLADSPYKIENVYGIGFRMVLKQSVDA